MRGTKAGHWVKDKHVTSLRKTDKTERGKMETKKKDDSPWRGRRGKKREIATWHFSWKGRAWEGGKERGREREIVSTVAEWTFAQCLSAQRTAEDGWCECVCVMCICVYPCLLLTVRRNMKSLIALATATSDLFHSERERDREWEGGQSNTEIRTKKDERS